VVTSLILDRELHNPENVLNIQKTGGEMLPYNEPRLISLRLMIHTKLFACCISATVKALNDRIPGISCCVGAFKLSTNKIVHFN
jgi:hypothetical protein